MLDKNGGRDVARKVILWSKNVYLLKVLHDWFLRRGGGEHDLDCIISAVPQWYSHVQPHWLSW